MPWLLGGYMWLYIHRPFEIWPVLATLQLERGFMLFALVWWLLDGPRTWVPNRLNAAFLGFASALLICWMASAYPDYSWKTVEDWLKVAVFYVLLVSTVRGEEGLKRIIVMYVAIVGVYMAHSLLEYCRGRYGWAMGTVRLLGIDTTYGDPNTFAATIVYSLPLALSLWWLARQRWQQALLAGYGLLSAVCVLLTGSRSGLVALCFLFFMVAMASRHRFKWLLLFAMMAPLAWNMLPEDRQNRFLTLIDPSYGPANAQESVEGRRQGWRNGVLLWNEHPIVGAGPGAFVPATGSGLESHHLYGQVLGEMGTLGALALAGILAGFFLNAWEAYRLYRANPAEAAVFPTQVIYVIVQTVLLLLLLGFAGHNLYRYTWLWFGAFQLIALDCLRQREAQRPEEQAEAIPASAAILPT